LHITNVSFTEQLFLPELFLNNCNVFKLERGWHITLRYVAGTTYPATFAGDLTDDLK